MSDQGKIVYGIRADNTQLQGDIEKAKSQFKNLSDSTQKEGAKMDNMIAKIGTSIGVAFSVAQAGMFAKQIATIRGEFQQLEVAFKTMLGSKVQADKLMSELIQTAATTPFDLKSIAGGAKSLLAYGSSAAEVNKELIMLGDVAAGLSIPLGDLVYLYGTTRTQGRMYTMDLNQFLGRGIPLADELAKQFGVGKDKVKELVEAGKVGFPNVQKALQDMTSEGGKFGGLMEAQSKTIIGQISNLGDAFDMMLNDIGRSNEGLISGVISGAKSMVENYENVGKVLAVLIATYGAAKAATIAYAAAQRVVAASSTAALYLEMSRSLGTLTIAHKAAAVGIGLQTKAQLALNAVTKLNPYVLAASALAALAVGLWALSDVTDVNIQATEEFNRLQKEVVEDDKKRKDAADDLIDTARNQYLADKDRAAAMNELRRLYPSILNSINLEKLSLEQLLAVKKEIAEYETQKTAKSQQDAYEDQLKKVEQAEARLKEAQATKGVNMTTISALMTTLEKERQLLRKYEAMQQKDRVNQWTADISDMTDQEIEKAIQNRQRALFALKGEKETNVANISGLGYFTASDIKIQNAALEAELANRRKIITQDKAYWEDQAKKAKESLEKMDVSQKGSAEWNRLTELIRKAEKQVAQFDTKERKQSKETEPDRLLNENRTLARSQENLELEKRQAIIDAKQDGIEKEIALNELEHDRKMLQLKRMQEDELQAILEHEKNKWEAGGKKGSAPTTTTLPESSAAAYRIMEENELKAFTDRNKKLWDDALAKYMGFKEREKAIGDKYDAEEKLLTDKRAGLTSEQVTSRLAKLKKDRKDELDALKKEILDAAGVLDIYQGRGAEFINEKIRKAFPLFEDITKLTKAELNELSEFIGKIDFTPEQIASINEAGESLEYFTKILDYYKKKAQDTTDRQEWIKVLESASKLAGSFRELGNALEGFDGKIGEIGKGIAALADGAEDVVKMFDKDLSKEDAIGTAVSGLSSIIGMIAGQIRENKKAQDEFTEAIRESNHQLSLGRIEALGYKESNIFGIDNPYAKAIAGAEQYAQAMLELNQMASLMNAGKVQTGTKQVVSAGNIGKGAGGGAALGAAIGSFIGPVGTLIGAGIGALVGAAAGALATKTVPVFESLASQYGEIFDRQTFELNPQIIADYEKLDDATKKLVDNWEEIRNKALEAEKQMRDTFQELAGEIGNQLSDALVNAFRNGDIYSAMDDFKGQVEKMIENVIQQMVFAAHFKKELEKLEKGMMGSFDAGKDGDILDDIIGFYEALPMMLEGYAKDTKAWQEWAKEKGFEIFTPDRTGVTKGIASASQDSVDELNGRFTAIQGHTYSMNQQMRQIVENGAAVLAYLSTIDASTAQIASDMRQVKAGIDSINTRGINIKV